MEYEKIEQKIKRVQELKSGTENEDRKSKKEERMCV